MSQSEQKVVQYLNEARGMEDGLVRELQEQIAITPRGTYRSALETHLRETRHHSERLRNRLRELNHGDSTVQAVVGLAQSAVGQTIAVAKTPLNLLRGSGGEEKVLKNAKDAYASEALEIATYTALERLAKAVGDETTAQLAESIRTDEEKMLDRIERQIPKLTDAVVRAEIKGQHVYDVTETGAADAVRGVADAARETARKTSASAKRTSRQARRVPGVTEVEGAVKGALASVDDLAIANYDSLTADEIVDKLSGLSQIDLAKIDAYERKNQGRKTILNRINSLRGDEPWSGYDDATAEEIVSRLRDSDDEDLSKSVREYERTHKARTSVMKAAERELARA